ncbi:substrate-binding periplasmic protein [Bdellovibrio bacteriovorus]
MNTILFLFVFFISLFSWAKPVSVKVGGYVFPPYVVDNNGKYNGLSLDLLQLLNQKQKKFHFSFILTSATRRYQDFNEKKYDVIFFESINWGWKPEQVTSSKIFQYGGEVFITHKGPGKNQAYFRTLKGKTIKATYGFHYAFLNYSTDASAMAGYNIELTNSQEANIRAVRNNRADLAIVTKEHLALYMKQHPDAKDELFISSEMDQIYRLGALIRNKDSAITVAEFNELIDLITKDGSWQKILDSKGIDNTPL